MTPCIDAWRNYASKSWIPVLLDEGTVTHSVGMRGARRRGGRCGTAVRGSVGIVRIDQGPTITKWKAPVAGKRPQAGQSRGWARPQRPDSRFGQACLVVAGTVGSRPRSRPCRIRRCNGMTNPPSAILMREPNVLPATTLRRSCIEGPRPTGRCVAACALSSVTSKPRGAFRCWQALGALRPALALPAPHRARRA